MRYTIMALGAGVFVTAAVLFGSMTQLQSITLTDAQGNKHEVYLHKAGNMHYISHDKEGELREAVTILPGTSEILPQDTKAWYDQKDTVVYVTKDNKLSAIYPEYSRCGLTKEQFDLGKQDQYVGIYPNPDYTMQYAPFYAVGPYAEHCFVFTNGTPHTAQPVSNRTKLVTT